MAIYSVYTVPMARVRAAYAFHCKEGHWFDRDAMRFFKTRLPRTARMLVPLAGGEAQYCFVTRETNPCGTVAYSVRHFNCETCRMATVGDFHSHGTRDSARRALESHIRAILA